MRKSKLINVGLAALLALTAGGLAIQHNELVALAEQFSAGSYQLESQKEELQARTQQLQARTERMSAANFSPTQLPDLVVSAPRSTAP